MQIQYHGHSCVQISANGHSLILDPFLTGNPLAVAKADDIQVQYVLLSHAHSDHMADAVSIAKRNNATAVATFELATYLESQGVNTHAMNIGGSWTFDFGRVKMTQAYHSSSIIDPDTQQIVYMGMPAGYVLTIEGRNLYFAGDTCLFSDMKWIGERQKIDVAFLPIGDNYTMGPEDALIAAEWLKADTVVPIHYNTFPPIRQDAEQFAEALKTKGIRGLALKPGESFEL